MIYFVRHINKLPFILIKQSVKKTFKIFPPRITPNLNETSKEEPQQ